MTSLSAPLTSARHPLARQARLLGRGPGERRAEGLFLVEGPRAVDAALEAGAPLVWLMVSADRAGREESRARIARALRQGVPVQPVRRSLLERIAPSASPQGWLAACRFPEGEGEPMRLIRPAGERLLLLCWEVQDPGNLGSIVRSAAAFGADGLVAAGGADPFGPRAVRAAAGAVHRLPIARAEPSAELIGAILESGYRLVAAAAHGGEPADPEALRGRTALVLGAETAGLPPEVLDRARAVTIPTTGAVESLSVAAAAAVLLSAAGRVG